MCLCEAGTGCFILKIEPARSALCSLTQLPSAIFISYIYYSVFSSQIRSRDAEKIDQTPKLLLAALPSAEPSVMLPPRRLTALLDQAAQHQQANCLFHNRRSDEGETFTAQIIRCTYEIFHSELAGMCVCVCVCICVCFAQ